MATPGRLLLLLMMLAGLSMADPQAPRMTAEEAAQRVQAGNVTFLDVRSSAEIAEHGTLAGYLHIPLDELETRYAELPLDKPVVTA